MSFCPSLSGAVVPCRSPLFVLPCVVELSGAVSSSKPGEEKRMSKRALLLGFLGALFLCGFTFFNDMVIRGSFLVGSFLPFSILGTLMLFVLFYIWTYGFLLYQNWAVQYVATEYGVAKLSGLSLGARAAAMAAIAHPDFREELTRYARENFR